MFFVLLYEFPTLFKQTSCRVLDHNLSALRTVFSLVQTHLLQLCQLFLLFRHVIRVLILPIINKLCKYKKYF